MNHPNLYALLTACFIPSLLAAQTITLYSNSFTDPNLVVTTAGCGTDISQQSVNDLWAGTGSGTGGGGDWAQTYTVETLMINGPGNIYTDGGTGGDYCVGMQTAQQNDKAALTLNSDGLPFVNLTMDISAVEISGCNGPFGLVTPVFQVFVYDTPLGLFNFSAPGTLLDQATLTGGDPSSDPFSFSWTSVGAGLDVSASTNGTVTVVLDLEASGFAAFDNILITADSSPLGIANGGSLSEAQLWMDILNARIGVASAGPTATWTIHDINGRIATQGDRGLAQGIDISELKSGTYILSWNDARGTDRSRFVVP